MYNRTLYHGSVGWLERFRPDAVYERYSLFSFAGLRLARRLGVPHLLEVNAPLRLERARTKGLVLEPIAARIERFVFAQSDGVFAVSTALGRYVVSRGASEAKAFVLPNGVDTERFRPGPVDMDVRRTLGIHGGATVIGFAGSLKPWHGTDLLIEAFSSIARMRPNVRLLIVGEGPEWDRLRAQALRLELSRSIVFTGRVDHGAMPAHLRAMDIAVAPYRDVPDFYFSPLKLYEYMAAGLGVIASEAGEIGALVRDGDNGLLCPIGRADVLASKLALLVDDVDLRRRLGLRARAHAEQHTWAANARRIADYASRRNEAPSRARPPIAARAGG